jgi:hypothetical protein
MSDTIGIKEVLARIDMSPDLGPVQITFVTLKGELRTINRAQKGLKKHKQSSSEGSNFKYRIKEKGVVIVANLDAKSEEEKWRTIKIASIIRLNNKKVIHPVRL